MIQSIIIFNDTNSGKDEEDAMIKKVNKLLVIVIIAVASIIEVGCTQSKNDNFKTGGSEQSMESTVDEGEISITNESDTISSGGEEGIEQEAVVESETEGAEQKRESIAIETAPVTRDDTILYGSIKTIDGFQMVDGTDVPVQVSFNVTNVQEGESAYKTLISGNAEIPKAENGMEYVVVTLNVTYDSGTPDNIYIMEDYASLDSAKMYFALSNGDSNAEQFTKHLSDSIYNLTVEKGKSAQGSVAFLRRMGSNEPLYFVGYGKTIKFDIATSGRSKSSMDTSFSETLAEQSIDALVAEKQVVINQLKKQAEDNAEKDRYNIIEALGDAESDERWSAANQFIQDRYPDYFSSRELLQSSIEYGHYLASLYKNYEGQNNGGGRYYEMGKLVSEAAQNVYLGINKSKDEMVVEKIQKLE